MMAVTAWALAAISLAGCVLHKPEHQSADRGDQGTDLAAAEPAPAHPAPKLMQRDKLPPLQPGNVPAGVAVPELPPKPAPVAVAPTPPVPVAPIPPVPVAPLPAPTPAAVAPPVPAPAPVAVAVPVPVPPPVPAPVPPPAPAAVPAPPVAVQPAPAPASPPAPAADVKPGDLLTGHAAEQAIAATPSAPEANPDNESLDISPLGVGPFRIGGTRADVLLHLGPKIRAEKERTAKRAPTIEYIDVPAPKHSQLLRVKIYGGHVASVEVLAHDKRAATDGKVSVGSTFEDVIAAHGDLKKIVNKQVAGWTASDLPGVVFTPEDEDIIEEERFPPKHTKIGRIVVTGAHAD